ncbi:MAG TPA: cyclic nucleotide-binding domain-containing protein [Thermoplasmata archaeon]|nr:cyclic nucleotide-binding domain-containing protein [Thermoplasmata archaeon]
MPVFASKANPAAMKMLEKVPIFANISVRERESLSRVAAERTFEPGAQIVQEGEKGVGFFLLSDGAAEVRRKGHVLKTLGPGDFFGEMALFEDAPRNAGVFATRPTQCLVFSRWEFWAFAMDKPSILRGMVEELAHRLGETDRALTD